MFSNQPLSASFIQKDPRFSALVKEAMNELKNPVVRKNRTSERFADTGKTIESSSHQVRTIRSILWKKLLDVFEASELSRIFSFFSMAFVSICLGLSLTYPVEAKGIALNLIGLENYIVPKIFLSIALVFSVPILYKTLRNITEELKFRAELNKMNSLEIPDSSTIEGIPIDELLDHLYTTKTFKRDDIENTFGLPRNRFTKLAKKLDGLGVLTRGENNSRILNEEFTRAELFSLLEGKSSASEIPDHSPTPIFDSRTIPQTSLAT